MSAQSAIDADRVAAVASTLGVERFFELLDQLKVRVDRIAAAMQGGSCQKDEIVQSVHMSIGSAASLGLIGLAAGLKTVLDAAPSEVAPEVGPDMSILAEAVDQAAAACRRLLEARTSRENRTSAGAAPTDVEDHG